MLKMSAESDVRILSWPNEAELRDHYRALGVPRLLIVDPTASAPVSTDIWEDWVRPPIRQSDLEARVAALRSRAAALRVPQLDSAGILRLGSQSVPLSPIQADLARMLLDNFGKLVPRVKLDDLLSSRATNASRNMLDLHIMRLRRRIRPLRLVIHTARARGYLLAPDTADA